MKTNLFHCSKPGQANQMALRYIFSNAQENEEIKAVAFSLIEAITGFNPKEKELRIAHIWPDSFAEVGLNIEICFGEDRYHLSFFFFEYDSKEPIEDEMLKNTACIRGDHNSKGCFLIHYRPEDADEKHLLGCDETVEGSAGIVHVNGSLTFDAIGRTRCSDPLVAEYIDYINAIKNEMTAENWGDVWLNSPVGFENYVENYLKHLFSRQYESGLALHFLRSGWKTGSMLISIDTGFDIYDQRGEFVDSWIVLEFQIEFPRPVATIYLRGNCFCFEGPEQWAFKDSMCEAFSKMREALRQEESLFLPKGKKSEPHALVGEFIEGGIPLKGEYAWSVLFPKKVFELTDNVLRLLKTSKSKKG